MSDGEHPTSATGVTGATGGRRRRRARVGRTGARFPRALPEDIDDDGDEPAARDHGENGDHRDHGEAPEATHDPGAPDVADAGEEAPVPPDGAAGASEEPLDDQIGRTGARFGSHARRTRREAARVRAEDAAVSPQAPPPSRAQPAPDDAPTRPLFLPSDASPESTRTRVRPYVRTGGRTRARADLAVETLVSIPTPRPPLEDPEHVALGEVVGDPRSVAEVAALLSVPLGVARVIIDDMAGAGLLLVHPRAVAVSGAPSRDIMQRVLDGLHKL